jgi:hypothetical protein
MAERIATIEIKDQEPREVIIVDNGENFGSGNRGEIPNHDKVEIIYDSNK